MIDNKFVIGISPRMWSNETQDFLRVSTQYTNMLKRDDIVSLILTPSSTLTTLLNFCDGFLLIGGDDLDPKYYHETNDLGLSKGINKVIDEMDFEIVNHAVESKKPLLGICRGIQDLAAFLNGSLYQDLVHDKVSHPLEDENLHYVDKVNNFGVAKKLGDHFLVNSYHHQAVKDVPNDFVILYKNADTIEAIEHKNLPLLGVQWHPERIKSNESTIIFDYFFGKLYERKNN